MYERTFPVWLIILLFGGFFLFALGYVNPYVSKANRAAVYDYAKGFRSDPPLVVIRDHIAPQGCLLMVALVSVASFVSFLIFTFPAMLADFGGGFLRGAFIVICATLCYFITFMILTFVYLMGATITSTSLQRKYNDRYGLAVEFEEDL